ncbi:DMT family transporter [Rubellimicrobium rubrum]|uniref:DMT family transporter n=1 Tax=Rubellimicrobium rubrum TaxID=2585369 RepID=A0A5C4N1H2_9RHOB|nr:DMT family transporter [Rubellimicrobium rubrum]TNC51195.1 DMT family transporter [Rubellimicrobium rubrum]
MAGSVGSFSLLAIAGRQVSAAFDTFEIMFYRSGVGFLIVAALLAASGRLNEARPHRLGLHVLRNLIHFTGQNLWFYALAVIPLAQVFALEFTTPLWVLLMAPLVLGERLTGRGLLAGVIGFGGVLLVARPEFGNLDPGILAAALCAICFAITSMMTKRLTRTQPVTGILFWLNAFQLALATIAVGWDLEVPVPSAAQLPLFIIIGITGLAAHWCLTNALNVAPASVVMPMDFVRLPLIAVVGWALYGERLDMFVVLGAAMILGGNLLTLLRQGGPNDEDATERRVIR